MTSSADILSQFWWLFHFSSLWLSIYQARNFTYLYLYWLISSFKRLDLKDSKHRGRKSKHQNASYTSHVRTAGLMSIYDFNVESRRVISKLGLRLRPRSNYGLYNVTTSLICVSFSLANMWYPQKYNLNDLHQILNYNNRSFEGFFSMLAALSQHRRHRKKPYIQDPYIKHIYLIDLMKR